MHGIMLSYKTYGLLLIAPYFLLIITFHRHLQTYDGQWKFPQGASNDQQQWKIPQDSASSTSTNPLHLKSRKTRTIDLIVRKPSQLQHRKEDLPVNADNNVLGINPRLLLAKKEKEKNTDITNLTPAAEKKDPNHLYYHPRNNKNHPPDYYNHYKKQINLNKGGNAERIVSRDKKSLQQVILKHNKSYGSLKHDSSILEAGLEHRSGNNIDDQEKTQVIQEYKPAAKGNGINHQSSESKKEWFQGRMPKTEYMNTVNKNISDGVLNWNRSSGHSKFKHRSSDLVLGDKVVSNINDSSGNMLNHGEFPSRNHRSDVKLGNNGRSMLLSWNSHDGNAVRDDGVNLPHKGPWQAVAHGGDNNNMHASNRGGKTKLKLILKKVGSYSSIAVKNDSDGIHKQASSFDNNRSLNSFIDLARRDMGTNEDDFVQNTHSSKIVESINLESDKEKGRKQQDHTFVVGAVDPSKYINSTFNSSQVKSDLESKNKLTGVINRDSSLNSSYYSYHHRVGIKNIKYLKHQMPLLSSLLYKQPQWNSNFPLQDHCVDPTVDIDNVNVQFQPLKGNYLYSAYTDNRLNPVPLVRVIALLKSGMRPQYFCHFPLVGFPAVGGGGIDDDALNENDPVISNSIHKPHGLHNGLSNEKKSLYMTGKKPSDRMNEYDYEHNVHDSNTVYEYEWRNASHGDYITMSGEAAQYYEMCENHGKSYGGWILTCVIPESLRQAPPPCQVIISIRSNHGYQERRNLDDYVIIPVLSTNPGVNYTALFKSDSNKTDFLDNNKESPRKQYPKKSHQSIVQNQNVFHELYRVVNSSRNISARLRSRYTSHILFNSPLFSIAALYSQNGQRYNNSNAESSFFLHEEYLPRNHKQSFGICVPPLFGYIPSTTFIEFIEMNAILGANHIVFYIHDVSGEIQRVLNYYKEEDSRIIITVIPWDIPVTADNQIWYHGQLLAINDCLYRSMHRFKYVIFNDLDEFVVPHASHHNSWQDMISSFHPTKSNQSAYSGYSFQSAFFDPLSSSTRMLYDLESNLRTKSFSRVRAKVMVMPERIYELGIHHISKPIDEELDIYYVETGSAYIHHYRQCVMDFDSKMNCQVYAQDETLLRYIPTLRYNVHRITWLLKELGKHYYDIDSVDKKDQEGRDHDGLGIGVGVGAGKGLADGLSKVRVRLKGENTGRFNVRSIL